MKALSLGIVALALLAAPFAACAEGGYTRSGAYVGVNGLYALENFDLDFDLSASNAPGVNVYAGYRFHPNFGLEGDLDYYGKFDIDEFGSKVGDVQAFSWTVNAKVFVFDGPVQPYGVVGVGGIYADQIAGVSCATVTDPNTGQTRSHCDADNSSHVGAVLRPGIGFDIYVTEAIVLNLQGTYVFPTGSQDKYQFGLLGADVQYRF